DFLDGSVGPARIVGQRRRLAQVLAGAVRISLPLARLGLQNEGGLSRERRGGGDAQVIETLLGRIAAMGEAGKAQVSARVVAFAGQHQLELALGILKAAL